MKVEDETQARRAQERQQQQNVEEKNTSFLPSLDVDESARAFVSNASLLAENTVKLLEPAADTISKPFRAISNFFKETVEIATTSPPRPGYHVQIPSASHSPRSSTSSLRHSSPGDPTGPTSQPKDDMSYINEQIAILEMHGKTTDLTTLRDMFPHFEDSVLSQVYDSQGSDLNRTIVHLLDMSS